jgi:2-methylcitrate dehydratase
MGCGIGAINAEPIKALHKLTSSTLGNPSSSILGSNLQTTPDLAAFVNGTMVRYLDYNDSFTGKCTAHPSDNIPVIMAAAEAYNSTGKELIKGIVIAYEVQSVWADSYKINEKGPWDQAVYATISTPLGAGKVMKLSSTQLANALSISVTQGISFLEARRGTLSNWKASAVPNAGRNGIFSALLAKNGITGPPEIFEGNHGFFTGITKENIDLQPLGGENGSNTPFRIMKSSLKLYPSGFFSQTAIEGAIKAREILKISDEKQIKKVTIQTFQHAMEAMAENQTRWKPETRETADHSLPYTVGCALYFGELKPKHFHETVLHDPKLLNFIQKINVEFDPECEALWPDAILNKVTIETNTGKKHTSSNQYYPGHFKQPMTDKEIEKKFRLQCNQVITKRNQDKFLKSVWQLEDLEDIGIIMTYLK